VAEAAMQASKLAAAASKADGWTDRITSDKWYQSMEKKGPHAPGQPLAVDPMAIGERRPKSPTPKPSMLPTGGFPANAGHIPLLDAARQEQEEEEEQRRAQSPPPLFSLPARSRSPSPTPPASAASTPERQRQQRQETLSLRSPAPFSSPSPQHHHHHQQEQPSSQPQQSPQQQSPLQPVSLLSVGPAGSSGLLLGTKRRSLAFPEFCRRLDHFLPPVGIPGPGFLYTHSCDPDKERNRDLTFRPKINPKSEEIMAARWSARPRSEVFELLHSEGALKIQRLEEARKERLSHLLDECTFRPFLFDYRGGQPHYHYPGEKVWVQRVAPTPRSRSAFAVERRGRFEQARPRSTPPVRLKGLGVYNKEHTPTHDWPKPVVRVFGVVCVTCA
jgi:hypothetical protein